MSINKIISPLVSRRNLIPNLISFWCISVIVYKILEEKNKTNIERVSEARQKFLTYMIAFWINDKNTINNILKSIVAILDKDHKIIGTWFFIWNKIALTAGHVLVGWRNHHSTEVKEIIYMMDLNWWLYNTGEKYRDTNNDIWLIRSFESSKWYLDVFSNDIDLDSKRIIPWFWGRNYHVTSWKNIDYMNTNNIDRDNNWILDTNEVMFTSNQIIWWNSWSPVLDINGNLIWIAVESFSNWWSWGSVFEPIQDIRKFITSL